MINKFTERAKKAIDLSFNVAKELGHEVVGSEHILLGLLQEKEGIAAKVLNSLGISEDYIKNKIIEIEGQGSSSLGEISLSPRSKRILELSGMFANTLKTSYIGTEHILLGLIQEGEGIGPKILLQAGLDTKAVAQQVVNMMGIELNTNQPPKGTYNKDNSNVNAPTLEKYGRNLTIYAKEGKLDPVIGRDEEIQRVIQILSRRTKNNPVLIGDPGVGKTAVIEGLASKISIGDVPEILKDKVVYTLDLGSMLAGAKYRGEFEERIKNVVDEVTKSSRIILFIDELHTIVGAGSSGEGAMDASNILKPALARGEVQIIGATTIEEYRKYIEKDAALERRFQPVKVGEPSNEDTIKILEGLRDKYEAHHKVKITDDAIKAAVELSIRYITDRYLPDKAIDLIDESASKVKLKENTTPKELKELEDKLEFISKEKEEAVRCQDFEKAAKIRDEEAEIKEKLNNLKENWRSSSKSSDVVDSEVIAEVVGSWTGIPVTRLVQEESEKLLNLEKILHNRVIGQEQAVESISKSIRRARAGLKDPKRPIGSFLFLGPTGVGKTELSKALAEVQFGDENSIIRIDMSEYMEKHSVSRLVGSPPGYVGHDEGGQLTEKVRRKPYSVILFDEIEKAHPDVFNILLQILDDGRLTDSKGRTVDFKNTIIIMTSNVGAHTISKQKTLGFSSNKDNKQEEKSKYEKMKENIMSELKQKFRPEFLNRIDDMIVFHSLNEEHIGKIVKLMTKDVISRLKDMNMNLELSEDAIKLLAKEGFDLDYGARPLKRAIQKKLEDNLSEEILKGTIKSGDTILVKEKDGEITFENKRDL
jgi:ATP-dependent Clp protease ATP-binding subunit ClpC